MPHESKLNIYTVELVPFNEEIKPTFKSLIKNKVNEKKDEPEGTNSYYMGELLKEFIKQTDKDEMVKDTRTNKCFTTYQNNLSEGENINLHSEKECISGIIEGGSFGKKRNKTNTINRSKKSEVSNDDAITDKFVFVLYTPLAERKGILMIHCYSDDRIDSVLKKFFSGFLKEKGHTNLPIFQRFIPQKFINDFKDGAQVGSLTYESEVLSSTLVEDSSRLNIDGFKVVLTIEPLEKNIDQSILSGLLEKLKSVKVGSKKLSSFTKKKGTLIELKSNKTTAFELEDENFEIKPVIILSNYLLLNNTESDLPKIRDFCLDLLNELKREIQPQYKVNER